MNSFYFKYKVLPVGVLLVIAISLFSCKKETNVVSDPTNYYIKYVIFGNGAYGRFSEWTATTPIGLYSNNGYQARSWTQTYGPVSKGFKCEVQIGNYISGAPTIEIHASKNQEPFALKVTNTGRSASYVVDF